MAESRPVTRTNDSEYPFHRRFAEWLGWCPNHPVMHTVPVALPTLTTTIEAPGSGSGAGTSGRIRGGFDIATGSFRILFRNKRLLWFSAGAGLVIVSMFLSLYLLHAFVGYPYFMEDPSLPISAPTGLALTFCVEFVCSAALCFLLASLVAGMSQDRAGNIRIREGLAAVKKSLLPLLLWAGILSLIVTAIYSVQIWFFPNVTYGIWDLFTQFPFYFIIKPEVYNYGPIGGGFHIISAISSTFLFMALTIMFIILTLFVVPYLVLERKTIHEAVRKSINRMTKMWKESLACILVFFLILLAFSAIALLFPIIYGIIKPGNLLFWYPGEEWIAAAYIYMAAWVVAFAIGLTAAGIAVEKLYRRAIKNTKSPQIKQKRTGPVSEKI
ncbi:MAG TPA: hypothetical protein PKM50_05725 [Methanoregula sp.]|nr:hypothetical protein [Methanoregula sp.]